MLISGHLKNALAIINHANFFPRVEYLLILFGSALIIPSTSQAVNAVAEQ